MEPRRASRLPLCRIALVGLLGLLELVAGGCGRKVNGETIPVLDKQYPDGTAGLKAFWDDLLAAAKRDERGTVHLMLASMIMSDDDLDALFGHEKAAYLKPRYLPMVSRLANVGALELVGSIDDRKYDDIGVFTVSPTTTDPYERATLDAVRGNVTIYGVRVKKKAENFGLRYDFFVYRDKRWITGNQIARYLVPEGTLPQTPSPLSSSAATPPPAAPSAPSSAANPSSPAARASLPAEGAPSPAGAAPAPSAGAPAPTAVAPAKAPGAPSQAAGPPSQAAAAPSQAAAAPSQAAAAPSQAAGAPSQAAAGAAPSPTTSAEKPAR